MPAPQLASAYRIFEYELGTDSGQLGDLQSPGMSSAEPGSGRTADEGQQLGSSGSDEEEVELGGQEEEYKHADFAAAESDLSGEAAEVSQLQRQLEHLQGKLKLLQLCQKHQPQPQPQPQPRRQPQQQPQLPSAGTSTAQPGRPSYQVLQSSAAVASCHCSSRDVAVDTPDTSLQLAPPPVVKEG